MKNKILIILALVLFLAVSSCKKKIVEKIEKEVEGTWKRINVTDISSDEYDEWHLNNGYLYVVHCIVDSTFKDTTNYGEYSVNYKHNEKIFSVPTSTNAGITGDWEILKLSSKYLTLYRQESGVKYLEFTK